MRLRFIVILVNWSLIKSDYTELCSIKRSAYLYKIEDNLFKQIFAKIYSSYNFQTFIQ